MRTLWNALAVIGALAGCLGSADAQVTLRVVPASDLKILDPDLDARLRHPEPWLPDLRHSVCDGRARRDPTADGRNIYPERQQAHPCLQAARRPAVV